MMENLRTVLTIIKKSSEATELNEFLNENYVKIGIEVYESLPENKIQSLKNTLASYYSSNYFHVGPRREMLYAM